MADPMSTTLTVLGLFLFGFGFLHRFPAFEKFDQQVCLSLNEGMNAFIGFFRYVWPLGTTPVAVVILAIMFIPGWQIGLIAAVAYTIIAIAEPNIKLRMNRIRPFNALPQIDMHQLKEPHDTSHPSGDAMRVWYLAFTLPVAFGLSWLVMLGTCLVAGILSLGRIALGVHYPLDVIGGTGLGLLAAGLTIISYHIFIFG